MDVGDEILARRLRNIRVVNRYSQEDIGKVLKLPKQSISRIENCKRKIAPNELAKLAKFYKISIDNIFDDALYQFESPPYAHGKKIEDFVEEFIHQFENYANYQEVSYKEVKHNVDEVLRVLNGILEEFKETEDFYKKKK
ncbi:MAG: helix-turn-helix transcriptional regulator [Actinobacteria bacterium]|nr:helix-turn-helix transcriptional regulator [Actinomycetota bacterium]